MMIKILVVALAHVLIGVRGSHFRGATISWRPTGKTNEAEFTFHMGWTYNSGPGCTENLIGQFVNKQVTGNNNHWQCTKGCPGAPVNITNVSYYCGGANSAEQWEEGEKTFTYQFPGSGPFTVAYGGIAWATLDGSNGQGGEWNVETVVDFHTRSDNGKANSSPVTLSRPIYHAQFDCNHAIRIPVFDPDGDRVRCRWAQGHECDYICKGLPLSHLDEDNCTITFNASGGSTYKAGGWYGVAITVEDFPTQTITIGGNTYTPNDPLTTTPLQFLIHTPQEKDSCDSHPIFVEDTPAEGAIVAVKAGTTMSLHIYATNPVNPNANVIRIEIMGPRTLTKGGVTPDDKRRPHVFYEDLTWTPSPADEGQHIVCAIAEDSTGRSSQSHCFTIVAWDVDPCDADPCHNGGSCTRASYTQQFTCTCAPGFTGANCTTNIDDCKGSPCQHGGTCKDGINSYTCSCGAGFTDAQCQTDIDECASNPCDNHGTCHDGVNEFLCSCPPGWTDATCSTNVDECGSNPCRNKATCHDDVNGYRCSCAAGWTDFLCSTNIDDCANNPCTNGGTCADQVNGFLCTCATGWTGSTCSSDIDECASQPCLNGGTCYDLINGYLCTCAPGYTGSECSINIDECGSNPCQNNATCHDQVNSFVCTCAPGYTDSVCHTNIDECASDPCHNGATCEDGVNGYKCHCALGYTDTQCQTDIDECNSSPCQNKATCLDQIGSYSCVCAPGFSGVSCELGTDHCASSPCQNGGVCVNGFQGYACHCHGGWTGKNCAVLLQTGPLNATDVVDVDWPDLQTALAAQGSCPRAAYSKCHCVIARNVYAQADGGDGDRPLRDGLAAIVGLPIGLLLGVVSFLLLERCCCSCASRSNVIPRVNPVRAYMSWPRFSGWRSARVRDPPSPPDRRRLTDRPVQHPDVLSPEGVSPRGERWGLPAVEYPSTHGQSRKGAAQVTNIYRAAFNDNPIGGTVNKKRPDTYASGHTDWNM